MILRGGAGLSHPAFLIFSFPFPLSCDIIEKKLRRKERYALRIQESAEDYLEAILVIKNEKGLVHSIDVARQLDFSKPSVSRAVKLLREDGKLTVGSDGSLELTEAGLEIAERIYERHRLLTLWFTELGVSEAQAAEDACRVEHDISAETFQKLKEHFGA